MFASRIARRLVELLAEVPALGEPPQESLRHTAQLLRVSYCPDTYPLNLYLFTSYGGPGGLCPPGDFSGEVLFSS